MTPAAWCRAGLLWAWAGALSVASPALGADEGRATGQPTPEPVLAQVLYRPEFRPVGAVLRDLQQIGIPDASAEPFGPWWPETLDGKQVLVPSRLLLQGAPDALERLLATLRRLDAPLPAVSVLVTVAEVRRRGDRQVGGHISFDRSAVPGASDSVFRGAQGSFEPEAWLRTQLTGGLVPFPGTSATFGAFEAGGQVFEHVLRALARRHDADILARSTLVVSQGTTSRLLSSVRIPAILISQVSRPKGAPAGGSVELLSRPVDAGLTLELTAAHVGPDAAELVLNINFSSAEPSAEPDAAAGDLVLRARRLETRLTVRDGESVVVGGLSLRRNLGDRRGMPLLDHVPALDMLVSADGSQVETTELVVLLSPRLLTPGGLEVPSAPSAVPTGTSPPADVPVPQAPGLPAPAVRRSAGHAGRGPFGSG